MTGGMKMKIREKIKSFLKFGPKEQILGYSIDELKVIFPRSLSEWTVPVDGYPRISRLISVEINAFYFSLLIDRHDENSFLSLIEHHFLLEASRKFNEAEVTQYRSKNDNERLVCLIGDEFEGKVVKMVTNDVDFIKSVLDFGFSVPPPWIVFRGVKPYWRPGAMQGAEGYYDDNFFSPFYEGLNEVERAEYLLKYSANDEWRKIIQLFYDESE